MAQTPVTITRDGVRALLGAVYELTTQQVLVGVPSTAPLRKLETGEKTPPSNAMIGYVMEHGDPARNIPARPHLIPGIRNVQPRIVANLREACLASLDGREARVIMYLQRAGLEGQRGVVQKITDGPFVPLAPATIKSRWDRQKSRRGKSMPQSFADAAKPLINTGQYRRSITFVLRRKL